MKQYIIMLKLIAIPFLIFGQNYSYPAIDKSLVLLWKNSNSNMNANSESVIDDILYDWALVKPSIEGLKKANFNPSYFTDSIDELISNLNFWEENKYSKQKGETAYMILWEFVHMRDCLDIKDYPLDDLLTAQLYFEEIQHVVHDEMMGLLYWFEFLDLIENFVNSWGEYDCKDIEEIHEYFSTIDPAEHNNKKESVNICLSNFIQSLDSANRIDFEIPCDEMGEALLSLIWSYSSPVETNNHLN